MLAPDAVSVDEPPRQTAEGDASAVTLGFEFTVTDFDAEVAVQLFASVIVTT